MIESKNGRSFFIFVVLSSLFVSSVISEAMEGINSIVIPKGSYGTTCGYCSDPGRRSEAPVTSAHSAALKAITLTCGVGVYASTRPLLLSLIYSRTGLPGYDRSRVATLWWLISTINGILPTTLMPIWMPFSQGQSCYKPNLQVSCCPQYTIKSYDIPLLPWVTVDTPKD